MVDAYQDAEDLNAGFQGKEKGGSGGARFVRLFINIGEKDGLNASKLVQFITESTDIEANVIDKVTVRDLSSFFNVPADAADYIKEHLAQKKFRNRKVRIDDAEQGQGGGKGGSRSGGNRFSGGEGRSYGGGGRSYGGGEGRSYGSRAGGEGRSYGGGEKRSWGGDRPSGGDRPYGNRHTSKGKGGKDRS